MKLFTEILEKCCSLSRNPIIYHFGGYCKKVSKFRIIIIIYFEKN